METLDIEIKLKKRYDSSSFITLLAYIFYGVGKRFEDYFWLNYLALALVIINLILIISIFLNTYQNKIAIPNAKQYFLKITLSFFITIVLGVLIATLFSF